MVQFTNIWSVIEFQPVWYPQPCRKGSTLSCTCHSSSEAFLCVLSERPSALGVAYHSAPRLQREAAAGEHIALNEVLEVEDLVLSGLLLQIPVHVRECGCWGSELVANHDCNHCGSHSVGQCQQDLQGVGHRAEAKATVHHTSTLC